MPVRITKGEWREAQSEMEGRGAMEPGGGSIGRRVVRQALESDVDGRRSSVRHSCLGLEDRIFQRNKGRWDGEGDKQMEVIGSSFVRSGWAAATGQPMAEVEEEEEEMGMRGVRMMRCGGLSVHLKLGKTIFQGGDMGLVVGPRQRDGSCGHGEVDFA
ncbi:hypothetical protein GW17_00000123 [Ensete ventricosum]|nr:hypothetical protein GW17_00000123 [Ensete ventricosum]RZS14313.1 hypothetical protein BHM03_00045987 [Ensete ventricosum]